MLLSVVRSLENGEERVNSPEEKRGLIVQVKCIK